MPVIQFDNGLKVSVDRTPTPEEVEEIARNIGITNSVSVDDRPAFDDKIASAASKITGISEGRYKPIDPLGALKRVSGVREFGQIASEVGNAAASGMSTAAFDIPRALSRVAGIESRAFPEPETPGGKDLKTAADVTGLFKGGAAKLAGAVGRLIKGRGFPKAALRGAAEGTVIGGSVSPKKPEDFFNPEERKNQALAGAIGGAAGVGTVKTLGFLGKASGAGARKMIDSLIKINRESVSYGKDPSRRIVNEGIIAHSFDNLERKVSQRGGEVFKRITQKLTREDNLQKRIDISGSLSPIDEAIAKAAESPRTNASVIKQLMEAKLDLMGAQLDDAGNIISSKNLSEISPLDATKIKRQVASITKFTGNPSDDKTVNHALKKVYGKIKTEINKAIPGLKEDNERLADLISAETLIKNRALIVRRQNIIDLPSTVFGTGIGVGTGDPVKAALSVFTASALRKGASSTPAKTTAAQLLRGISGLRIPKEVSKSAGKAGAIYGSSN